MRARSITPSSICSAARAGEKLEDFRGYKGAQSYPSRTKDADDVDFSTGSVGLGVAQTLFSSLVQDYVRAHGWGLQRPEGRMIALVGDAELDEGNIFEAMLEGWKQGLRNCWWIIDYNRQSLDAVIREGLWARYEALFKAFGWDVVILKYGSLLQQAFREPGGERLRQWIDNCPNQLYSALVFQGGAAWRKRLLDEIGDQGPVTRLIETRSDDGAGAADDQSRRATTCRRCSRPSARSITTGRSASSATPSRASGCRSPATRTTMPA